TFSTIPYSRSVLPFGEADKISVLHCALRASVVKLIHERHLLHHANFNRGDAEVFRHLALQVIKAPSPKRKFPRDVGKVYGVKNFAVRVVKGSEVHGVTVFCTRVLSGDEITEDRYTFSDLCHKFFRGGVPEVFRPRQLEGIAKRKSDKLDLVEGVFHWISLQRGEWISLGLGIEQLRRMVHPGLA